MLKQIPLTERLIAVAKILGPGAPMYTFLTFVEEQGDTVLSFSVDRAIEHGKFFYEYHYVLGDRSKGSGRYDADIPVRSYLADRFNESLFGAFDPDNRSDYIVLTQ